MALRTKIPYHNHRPPNSLEKLSEEMCELIIKYYRLGLKDSTIANLVGVSPLTIKDWIIRGAYEGEAEDLHRKLSKGARQAVGQLEVEFAAEIRKAALGSPAEFACDEIIYPDGRIEKKIKLDGEGNPIVLKEERKPNVQWSAWFLERRFRDTWGQKETLVKIEFTPDDIKNNAANNNSAHHTKHNNIPMELSKEEQLEMLEIIKQDILKDEKDVK